MLPYHSRPMIMMERTRKSNIEQAPNCPRYFCKGCRRYWTKGGSLRNVPVGGGCRKSRRSRSARKDDNTLQTRSPTVEAAGADIDLADVFAKYLNQGTTDDQDNNNILQESQDYSSIGGASLSDSPSSDSLVNPTCFENESLLDETIMGNLQDYPCDNFLQGGVAQDFLDFNTRFLEMQAMLGDEIIGQAEEFDHYNNTSNNFAWQPMMQFQDFGSILELDDQLKNSTPDLASDNNNCSSFDLSNYI
ncbi:hypothetical protein HAX54_038508 [Datura stramonium]|uniref:Dof zinc finger protein n=1 Tax=Datura stramonium TaxID=4076 RepID=A0ABS8SIF7_DATST|nr:hypothetical protein [Datura stramonium]